MVTQRDIKIHPQQKKLEINLIFFLNIYINFLGKGNSNNSLDILIENVSDDKYLKLYKIKSNLVDFNEDTLENYIKYTYEKDDLFFGLNANIYQTLKETTDEKYEYILPEITLDKNLYSDEDLGIVGLQSNLKIHNFQTNKLLNSFVNDFD